MRATTGFAAVVMMILGGCASPPPPEPVIDCETALQIPNDPTNSTIPKLPGTSGFKITPATPVVTTGVPTTLRIEFEHNDCYPFFYHGALTPCPPNILQLRIGDLEISANHETIRIEPLGRTHCNDTTRVRLAPDQPFWREIVWNGTVLLVDHRSVEQGQPWTERYVPLAPGEYDITVGFDGSWQASRSSRLIVLAGDPGDGRSLGACTALWDDGPYGISSGSISVSPSKAALGETVMVHVSYEVSLPGPGCYLFERRPHFSVRGDYLPTLPSSRGPVPNPTNVSCWSGMFPPVWVQATGATVVGYLNASWNATSLGTCYLPIQGGEYEVNLLAGPSFVGTRELATTRMIWT